MAVTSNSRAWAQALQAIPEMPVVPGLGDDFPGRPQAAAQGQVHDGLLQGLQPLAGEGGDLDHGKVVAPSSPSPPRPGANPSC